MSEDGGVTDPAADKWSYFPPPADSPPPWQPPPRASFAESVGVPLMTFAGMVGVLALAGAPLALLWRAFAPVAVVLKTASGPQPAAPESSQVFATDGWFAVVSLVTGLVLGAVAWIVLRHRGPAVPFGLAAGGTVAALVASAVGRRMVVDRYVYDFCRNVNCLVYDGTLRLHALAAVVVLPVAMLAAYVALTFFLERD